MWRSTYHRKWHDKNYPYRIFSLTNSLSFISLFHNWAWVLLLHKAYSREGFYHKGPLWSLSIFTSYQQWQKNNESYLHQTILGPLPKPLCYVSFFKGWHHWQPTLINNLPLWHWSKHFDATLKSYHSCSPWNHAFVLC